jgi:hypothetical protein
MLRPKAKQRERLRFSVHRITYNILVRTFRSPCYIAASTFHELRKVMGTSKPLDSGAAFPFEVPEPDSPLAGSRNFK